MIENYYVPSDVAELLSLESGDIANLMANGQLKFVLIDDKVRIAESEIERLLETSTIN